MPRDRARAATSQKPDDSGLQSTTTVASISIRKSGTAKAETPIQMLAGGFPREKNSLAHGVNGGLNIT